MRALLGTAVATAMLFLSVPTVALSYADYMRGREYDSDLAGALIVTMGQSFTFANAMLSTEGRDALYCPPPRLKFGAETYDNILDGYLEAKAASGDESVEGLLLFALMDMFPC